MKILKQFRNILKDLLSIVSIVSIMVQDFAKGKIYKITNDLNDDIYVGSTCDTLVRRYQHHKSDMKKEKTQNIRLYKLMNEIGFERFRIQLIEDYPSEDLYHLRQREGYWIRQIGTLNMKIDDRTKTEYHHEYYQKHKEFLNAKGREYNKTYHQNNKDEINLKHRERYEENKEKIRVRIICECGAEICKRDKAKHERTKKHIALVNNT